MISQAQKIGLCLIAVGSVAGVSVGAVAFKETQNSQEMIKAATGDSTVVTDKAYFILDSIYWGQATAYYTIDYWGGTNVSGWPGKSLTLNSATGAYEGTYDSTSTNVIITRWAEEAHTTEWNRIRLSFTANTVNCFKNTGWTSADSYLVSQTIFDTVFEAPSTYTTVDMHYWDTYSGLTTAVWPGKAMTQVSHPYKGISSGASTIWRYSGALLNTGTTRSGFVFNVPGADPEVKTVNLYGSAYANAFTTTACLTDSADRIQALDFLDYFQVLRVDGSICGVKTDSEKKQTLSSKYSALSTGAKTLVNATTDEGDTQVTVGETIAMLLA